MDSESNRQPYISFVRSSTNLNTNTNEIASAADAIPERENASEIYQQIISLPSTSAQKKRGPTLSSGQPTTNVSSQPPVKPLKSTDIFKFCQSGKLNECQQWIASGFDVNLRDPFHWTPLMVASCSGHTAVVKLLLDSGANCDPTCPKGKTALDLARKSGHKQVVKLIGDHLKPTVIVQHTKSIPAQSSQTQTTTFSSFECTSCGLVAGIEKTLHESSIAHQLKSGQFSSQATRSLGNFAHVSRHFKGYQLLRKEGWNGFTGLGAREEGRKYPVVAKKKPDRAGIGQPERAVQSGAGQTVAEPIGRRKLKYKLQRDERRRRKLEADFRRSFH